MAEIEQDRKRVLEILETVLELQLRSVRQLLNRKEDTDDALPLPRRRGRRRKSLVDLVVELLTEEKGALHVDALVELLRQRYGRVTERDALSSALSKKAGPEGVIVRVQPATFALRQQR